MSSLISSNNSGELNSGMTNTPNTTTVQGVTNTTTVQGVPIVPSVPNKQDILMRSLTEFFQDNNYIEEMLPIISGESKISLRIIDWFVTNYAKKNNTCLVEEKAEEGLEKEKNTNIKQFLVFLNYKSQLKAYTKKQFDPFCRRERIDFFYDTEDSNKYIETTVGQLNFFRWAIKNQVLNYITKNLNTIEHDMNNCIRKANYKKDQTGIRRRRQELSVSATKTANKHLVNITINFE